ncbi:MAG TPA: hypothetical protein VE954_20975 [Oligoflexus sp.]|uniref:hypothetical protein n=1 Tax=Oligoflexus sp. TaxID=1971216 RepID=UPI002D63DF86|nr:hypothetical protein [Oligoflexus sp.]HYX35578.1 hypothetical protein [Oligoflexus sp.]
MKTFITFFLLVLLQQPILKAQDFADTNSTDNDLASGLTVEPHNEISRRAAVIPLIRCTVRALDIPADSNLENRCTFALKRQINNILPKCGGSNPWPCEWIVGQMIPDSQQECGQSAQVVGKAIHSCWHDLK